VLFLSFIFGVVGIEVSASHAREAHNVRRNYPIAVFSAAVLGFVLTLLGGLAVAAVLPVDQLDLISGSVQALQVLLNVWHLGWLLPVSLIPSPPHPTAYSLRLPCLTVHNIEVLGADTIFEEGDRLPYLFFARLCKRLTSDSEYISS